jgi:twinkle protein
MKLYCTNNQTAYEVPIGSGKYTGVCPVCSADRSKKANKCFSFDTSKEVGHCMHCDAVFVKFKETAKDYTRKAYIKPVFINNSGLSDSMFKYFEGRGISKFTIKKMQITEQSEWMPQVNEKRNCICFNYFRGEELVNIKFRDGAKNFKLVSDAELIPYNLNSIKGQNTAVWVEGEFDCLAFIECGISNVLSVPNGANVNLTHIDNCINEIDSISTHIIAVDQDEKGEILKNELVRRFGSENCKLADFKDCKDANEYLIKYGLDELKKVITDAKEIPLSGIYSVDGDIDGIIDLWEHGMPPGLTTEHKQLNEFVTWVSGVIAVWTGIPSHGKSEWVDEINVQLNIRHDWKVAYFSPENHPTKLHISKIVSRISGKKFSKVNMNRNELDQTISYVKENFFFIQPDDDDLSLDSILAHAKSLIKRQGIKILVIDPWNKIEHKMERGESETTYISKALDKLTTFAIRNDILIHLVAHPTKIKKNLGGKFEIPTLYDISGSANFYNKAFYGFCVYREDVFSALHILKVKFRHLGSPGIDNFQFNINNGRFVEIDEQHVNMPIFDNNSYLRIEGETIPEPDKMQPNTSFYDSPVEEIPF